MVDVAIIGAGPYGLSIATQLAAYDVPFRIFGNAMHTWRTQMPKGMRLKSEGFASTLYDAKSAFTLGTYCHQRNIPYADIGLPVQLDTFIGYGEEFQRRLVPNLEPKQVAALESTPSGFGLLLEDGERLTARRVVVAVGISHFQYTPPILADLPPELVSHSSARNTYDCFRGCEVTVIGGGASAADVAVALADAGASTQIVARKPVIRFHDPPGTLPRPLLESIRNPMTGLGPGWRSLLCTEAPLLFHKMPESFRLKVVRKHLGPAPGWFVKEQLLGRVLLQLGMRINGAKIRSGRVHLEFADAHGVLRTLVTDHVIAATGYKVDLGRLAFLQPSLRSAIQSVEDTPVLSTYFESSVPGLYFVGAASANNFGPMARFAYGAGFTSRRISNHLARSAVRQTLHARSTANDVKTQPEPEKSTHG
jgi:thioredoxin reductase